MHNELWKDKNESTRSFWLDSCQMANKFPPLQKELYVDIAIIGGGICGITTGILLKEAGYQVAIFEARKIAGGATGHTTAKITSQHHLIYNNLIKNFGQEGAIQYADANQKAVEQIAVLVDKYKIDCNFERQPAYVYTLTDDYIEQIEQEVNAAQSLGIPAKFVQKPVFPIEIKASVMFENQAQFHPVKYIDHLSSTLNEGQCQIYENTRITTIEGDGPFVLSTQDHKIQCKKVVIATHFPIHDKKGFYFSRMYVEKSYLLGIQVKDPKIKGMFINAETPVRSFRIQPTADGPLVLIGGETHKTGQDENTLDRYAVLEKEAKTIYPDAELKYRWSAQDCMPMDSVPYIGQMVSSIPDLYVATGFSKWGMTGSTAAAMILTDLISDRDNPNVEIFNPSRFKPLAGTGTFLSENLDVAKHFIKGHLQFPKEKLTEIAPELKNNESRIVDYDGNKVGMYKDHEGALHYVNTTCTHMGCQVHFNTAEKTWDCPCHGSSFTYDGDILEAPAVNPLDQPKSTVKSKGEQ